MYKLRDDFDAMAELYKLSESISDDLDRIMIRYTMFYPERLNPGGSIRCCDIADEPVVNKDRIIKKLLRGGAVFESDVLLLGLDKKFLEEDLKITNN